MNLLFLILIAIPLGVYLLVLIAWTRDFNPDGESSKQTADAFASTTPEMIQDAAVAPVTAADTHTDDPAITAPPAAEESAVAALETDSGVAQMTTAENTADPVLARPGTAVIVSGISEPAPESINNAPATLEQDTPSIEQSPPAQPEEAPQSISTVVSSQTDQDDPSQPILSGQPLILPGDSPKYAFDYRGRLWVEKKRRGFFRQLRRPQLPPEDPTNPPNR